MRNSEWDAHVGAVHQNVREPRQWTRHWRTEPVTGSPSEGFGDLGRRRLCPATGQRVDPAIDAAVANSTGQEAPEAVTEIADQMSGNGFDIPSGAQTQGGQLVGTEAIDESGDRRPLVSYRTEDLLAFIPAETHRSRIAK